ncbi:MAG: transporter substrate-binding domain-containing protein [Spirochaetales bacterium]|nr:transporter substrate-binding domain-containing protein [Spirochaetales bacterium]
MKRSLFLLPLLLIVISCLSPQKDVDYSEGEKEWLKEHEGKLVVLFGYDAPPNAYYDGGNRYTGILVDLFYEIEKTMGIDISFKMFSSWPELVEYAKKERNFIIVGISRTGDLQKYLGYTPPVYQSPYVLVCRKSEKIIDLDMAGDRIVGVEEGNGVNEFLEDLYPNIASLSFSDNLAGLRAVSTGAIDVFVVNQLYASWLINQEGLSNLTVSGESGYRETLHIAVSRRDRVLLDIAHKTLRLIDFSTREKIYRGWVGNKGIWLSQSMRNWLFILSGFFLALILFMLVWLYLLRRIVVKQTGMIQEKERELQRTERIKSIAVLAGGIAHDFNNLLSGIYGYMELARDLAVEKSEQDNYLKSAVDSMYRARRLTGQLLSLTSERELEIGELDLGELVRETVNFVLSGMETNALFHFPRNMWTIRGDRGQLDQVITNLTVNASQAMKGKGEIVFSLENVVEKGTRFVRLDVSDTGAGIEEENLPHIFDPYFTTKEMGSGLGLASSFTIIQKHGGELRVSSQKGEGTVFTVLCPVSS